MVHPHKMFLHFRELLQNLLNFYPWLHPIFEYPLNYEMVHSRVHPHKMFLHFRELLPNVLYSDCKPLHTDFNQNDADFNQFYIGFTPAFTP